MNLTLEKMFVMINSKAVSSLGLKLHVISRFHTENRTENLTYFSSTENKKVLFLMRAEPLLFIVVIVVYSSRDARTAVSESYLFLGFCCTWRFCSTIFSVEKCEITWDLIIIRGRPNRSLQINQFNHPFPFLLSDDVTSVIHDSLY